MALLSEEQRRIAHAAGDLFYRDGFTATGVAPLSKAAGISKRTLYERFGDKDGLITAALEVYDEPVFAQFVAAAEQAGPDPRDQLLGLFDGLGAFVAAPGYRGCPFVNAAAELPDPGHPARAAARDHKERLRRWLAERSAEAGAKDPGALSRELMVVFDGALAQALVSGEAAAAEAARSVAATLIGAHLPDQEAS